MRCDSLPAGNDNSASKTILQPELNLTRRLGSGNATERRRVEIVVWIREIEIVERVKELRPKLDTMALLDGEVLKKP